MDGFINGDNGGCCCSLVGKRCVELKGRVEFLFGVRRCDMLPIILIAKLFFEKEGQKESGIQKMGNEKSMLSPVK